LVTRVDGLGRDPIDECLVGKGGRRPTFGNGMRRLRASSYMDATAVTIDEIAGMADNRLVN
jgi:hypothetical protein